MSERVWNILPYFSAHQSGTPICSSLLSPCLSCLTNTAHISRTLPPQWRARTSARHTGEWEGRICNTLGSCIQTWGDEFVQTFRGKTSSLKPFVVIKCLASLLPIVVFMGAWEWVRDATVATRSSFFKRERLSSDRTTRCMSPSTSNVAWAHFAPHLGATTEWSTDIPTLRLMHQVPIPSTHRRRWFQLIATACHSPPGGREEGTRVCGVARVFLIFTCATPWGKAPVRKANAKQSNAKAKQCKCKMQSAKQMPHSPLHRVNHPPRETWQYI